MRAASWSGHGRHPQARVRKEIDYGRRGKGYIFGAFCPATGTAFTRPYLGRGTANWVAFLEQVEDWLPHEVERVHAIAGNLSSHRATDVLLFMLAHPRSDMVFQPKYMVESATLSRPRWTLRDLGGGVRRRRASNRLLDAHRHPFL